MVRYSGLINKELELYSQVMRVTLTQLLICPDSSYESLSSKLDNVIFLSFIITSNSDHLIINLIKLGHKKWAGMGCLGVSGTMSGSCVAIYWVGR